MKTVYDMDDVFLASAAIFIGVGITMKLFAASWTVAFTKVNPGHFIKLGIISLLFNLAFNIHEIARRK